MVPLKKLFVPAILLVIPLVFFYKSIFFGLVPFPGDLLVGRYEPYTSDVEGLPNKGQGSDVIRQIYPWKYFSIEQIKQGQFPLWNPYNFSGNPHFANLQSGVLYPVNILFFLLPFIDAWTIYIILQYVFSLIFTYLYLREIELKKIPSLFGAVAFSFCAFFTVWAEYGNVGHSLSFLPLILLSTEKILKKQKWYWYAILITSFPLSIFAGYIQLTMYVSILFVFYVLFQYQAAKKNAKVYISLLVSFAAGLLLSSIQLLPLYEFLNFSLRTNYSYNQLIEKLLPLQSMVTILVPDFFGNPATNNYFLKGGSSLERASNIGVWPLVFAFFAVFLKRKFYNIFFLTASIITYISCLSIPPITYIHSIGIPFLSTAVPTRALGVFAFCLSTLGAIGLNSYILSDNKRKIFIKIIFLTSAVFTILWLLTFIIKDPNLLISRRNLILPSAIFISGGILIFLRVPKKITAGLIVVFTIIELFYSFQKFNSFVPKTYVYPDTQVIKELSKIQGINRYWGYGSAYIEPNFQVIGKNYLTDGYDPLFIKRYAEFTSASRDGRVKSSLGRTIAGIHGGYGVNTLKKNRFRKRALDLLGVKYILNKNSVLDSAFDQKEFELIWQKNGWQIYENKKVIPRINLFGSYKLVKDRKKIIENLYNPEFKIRDTLILENRIPHEYNIEQSQDSLTKLLSYNPNKIVIATKSSKDQLLFISDNYFPGWKAKVDGHEAPVFVADYSFRAVPVKRGKHNVEVYYSPYSFWLGLWISVGTFTCLILFFFFARMKSKHDKNS